MNFCILRFLVHYSIFKKITPDGFIIRLTIMPSIVAYFLIGPTAVRKSSVAQWIAENAGYEILSADSMLVYTGMDIGTAKPSAADRSSVRYHGINLTTPNKPFSVWAYRRYACNALTESALNGRKTIVVGGTGLYIKSLTDGLTLIPSSDPELREYWTRALEEKGVGVLQEALREKSAVLYESLRDKQNGRRLIRALELAETGIEKPRKTWVRGAGYEVPSSQDAPLAGLMLPADQLKSSIELRVAEMYRAGFVEEVRGLLERYAELSFTARQAIGYAEVIDFLNGRCSLEDAAARTVIRTRQLAKRQKTWFRNQADVRWIDIDIEMTTPEIAELVLDHWKKYGPTEIRCRSAS